MKKLFTILLCSITCASVGQRILTKKEKETHLLAVYNNVYNQVSVMLYDQAVMPVHGAIQKFLENSPQIQEDLKYLANLDSIPDFDIAVALNLGKDFSEESVKKSQGQLYDHMTYKHYDIVLPVITSTDTNKFLNSKSIRNDFAHIMAKLNHPLIGQKAVDSLYNVMIPYDAVFEFVEKGDEKIYSTNYQSLFFLQKNIGGLYESYQRNKDVIHASNMLAKLTFINTLVVLVRMSHLTRVMQQTHAKNGLLIINPNVGEDGLDDLRLICNSLNIDPNVYTLW